MLIRRAEAAGCALLVLALPALTYGCSGSTAAKSTATTQELPTTPGPTTARRSTTTTSASTTTTDATPTSDTSDTSGTPTTTTTLPETTTTPDTTPVNPTSLAALILGTSLPGYALQPDAIADTGPTNLATAINSDISLDARTALLTDHFLRGYQRQWTGEDTGGNTSNAFEFLYQFQTPAGAVGYTQHWHTTLVDYTPKNVAAPPFTPSLIPGAIGVKVEDDVLGSTGVVIFSKGVFAVEILVNGGPKVDQSGPANQVALAQYLRLP